MSLFDTKKGQIPGYTGHQKTTEVADKVQGNREPSGHIPGYGGYVTGIKSENIYGQTFGKTSYASAAQTFERGMQPSTKEKFSTTSANTLIDHSQQVHKTVAEIVGIERKQDEY